MALTLEQFKTELISKYRKNEFDQFIHLLIKANSWSQILTLLKTEPLKFILYGIRKGIITEEFLLDIPVAERELNLIFNSVQSITDSNSTIFLFQDAELTLNQTNSFRCKIVMIGSAVCNVIATDTSMIEIDCNENSYANINAKDNSFLYITKNDNSNIFFVSNANATTKLMMNGNAQGYYQVIENAFVNGYIKSTSILNLESLVANYTMKVREEAVLNIINNNPH